MKLVALVLFCVALVSGPAVADSPGGKSSIKGKIVQIIPDGKKTVLVLNKGKRDGVALGAVGTVDGVKAPPFKITEVSTFRAKASIAVKSSELGNARSFQLGGQAVRAPKAQNAESATKSANDNLKVLLKEERKRRAGPERRKGQRGKDLDTLITPQESPRKMRD